MGNNQSEGIVKPIVYRHMGIDTKVGYLFKWTHDTLNTNMFHDIPFERVRNFLEMITSYGAFRCVLGSKDFHSELYKVISVRKFLESFIPDQYSITFQVADGLIWQGIKSRVTQFKEEAYWINKQEKKFGREYKQICELWKIWIYLIENLNKNISSL